LGEPDFLSRLSTALEAERLFAPQEHIVVGVSGGSDSMALLHGLAELARGEGAGWRLHVAHLNHRLRGAEADRDAEFVLRSAEALGLASTIASVDVAGPGEGRSGGWEESARRRRYEFFERVCLQQEAAVVAIGHHADDNAETILHHIIRGTGFRGLRGMLPRRELREGSPVHLVRPLLGFRREELAEFLERRGIACRVDSTNADLHHTRNRIRHQVMPLLSEAVNPQAVEALLRLGAQARLMETFLLESAERLLAAHVARRDEGVLALSTRGLEAQPRILQLEMLRLAIVGFGLGERSLGFSHLSRLADMLHGRAGDSHAQLPGGLRVSREKEHLVFSLPGKSDELPPLPEVPVSVPGTTELPPTAWSVEARVEPATGGEPGRLCALPRHEEWLDYERVAPPLTLRGPEAGDRFRPLGSPGGKKLSDFFIDHKIPPRSRSQTPILCDRRGVLWVVPYRIDDRAKVTETTSRLLKLSARTRTERESP
jgi:tRNA(Ile)-lysidine synthase